MVKVMVPATSANLGPGFDCLGLALCMYNTVEISASPCWQLSISGEGAEELPTDQGNLVWRAACRLWQQVGVAPPPVHVHLHNQIPPARGLGSSAAAVVGGLVAANYWLGQPLSTEELLALACELEGHPDNVAPALVGGLVVSSLDNQTVHWVRLEFPESLSLALCIPDYRLDTSEARAALPEMVSHGDAVFNLSRTALLVAALAGGRDDLLPLACQDRLHQPYRQSLLPGFLQAEAAAREAGALVCVLSGAGPSLLALAGLGSQVCAIGRAMVAAYAAEGENAYSLLLEPDLAGARVIVD